MQKASKHGEELGLNFDELAFYDALAENESAMRDMGDEILKNIAIELTKKATQLSKCRLAEA